MKNRDARSLVLIACVAVIFSDCASTDNELDTTNAATKTAVPGEVNPNAPDASQQVRTRPGFNF